MDKFYVWMFAICCVISFGFGIEFRNIQILTDEVNADKLEYCVYAYKMDSARTLADSFCDEFFTVIRGSDD